MHDPLVSVIVPVYNVEAYLPFCLRAISEQTYQTLEIILVDDGSTDRSGEICEAFAASDSRARVIHQPNTGLWAARNTGHKAAHGDYLFFPDADDYFCKDLVWELLNAIREGGYGLALCKVKSTDCYNESVSFSTPVKIRKLEQEDLFHNLFKGTGEDAYSVYMWNKLFRRDVIKDLQSNDYQRSQDKDYMIRLLPSIHNAAYIENRFYYWVQRPDSLTHSPESLYLFHQCRTLMCYENFKSLPKNGKRYAHYLLEELYTRMLFWRNQSWGRQNQDAIFKKCSCIIADTWNDYLNCREIPLWKRALCLVLAYNPVFTRVLMKISKN